MAGRKKNVDAFDIIFGQLYFRREFFKKNPQCGGCEHVENWILDWNIYNQVIKEKYCNSCGKYEGAGWDAVDEIVW